MKNIYTRFPNGSPPLREVPINRGVAQYTKCNCLNAAEKWPRPTPIKFIGNAYQVYIINNSTRTINNYTVLYMYACYVQQYLSSIIIGVRLNQIISRLRYVQSD